MLLFAAKQSIKKSNSPLNNFKTIAGKLWCTVHHPDNVRWALLKTLEHLNTPYLDLINGLNLIIAMLVSYRKFVLSCYNAQIIM